MSGKAATIAQHPYRSHLLLCLIVYVPFSLSFYSWIPTLESRERESWILVFLGLYIALLRFRFLYIANISSSHNGEQLIGNHAQNTPC